MIFVCHWCYRQFSSKRKKNLCPDCKFAKATGGYRKDSATGTNAVESPKPVGGAIPPIPVSLVKTRGGEMMGLSRYGASSQSKYPPLLNAADIKKPVTYTIKSAEERQMKGENKLVIGFTEIEKQWVVNKTNAGALAANFGDVEPRELIGKTVTLASVPTQYQGQATKGIRVVG